MLSHVGFDDHVVDIDLNISSYLLHDPVSEIDIFCDECYFLFV